MGARDAGAEKQPSLVDRVMDAVAEVSDFVKEDRQKLGGMTMGAHGRLGLAELREAFSMGGNIEQPTPYGMYGAVTPGEVAAGRQDDKQNESQSQQMEQEPMGVYGGKSLVSPSEIAAESHPYTAEPDHGLDNTMDHNREQGHGR